MGTVPDAMSWEYQDQLRRAAAQNAESAARNAAMAQAAMQQEAAIREACRSASERYHERADDPSIIEGEFVEVFDAPLLEDKR